MSRIGKQPIKVPKGVEVKFAGGVVHVKGPKGALEKKLPDCVSLKQEGDTINLSVDEKVEGSDPAHGLSRTLIANMVQGVTTGYSRSLTLVGVGYRAVAKGKGLTLTLGYSHPIDFDPPPGIELKVDKLTTVIINGAAKDVVGQVAATLRGLRPPEPYHGKGVRYSDEVIATKVGKAAAKAK